ncbi:MAG: hypothetical protein ACYDDI_11370 [Candidatus Acidiferrales bacterium]
MATVAMPVAIEERGQDLAQKTIRVKVSSSKSLSICFHVRRARWLRCANARFQS